MERMTGKRFGRLVVLAREGRSRSGKLLWRCICDCGTEKVVFGANLRNGKTKSCGCIRREQLLARPNPGRTNPRPRRADLIGQKFGRLTVLRRAGKTSNGEATWACRCECGGDKEATTYNLRCGLTKSCGCLHREVTAELSRTHGMCAGGGRHPLYKTWSNMIARCQNAQRDNFKYYGGRGIKVCDRWRDGDAGLTGFECFLADMGPKPTPCHTLDRIDNDGNYEPGNCRWATQTEQVANSRKVLGNAEARP
ncbi:hypothetical protein ACVCNR_14785 [Aquamicrobium terrae]